MLSTNTEAYQYKVASASTQKNGLSISNCIAIMEKENYLVGKINETGKKDITLNAREMRASKSFQERRTYLQDIMVIAS